MRRALLALFAAAICTAGFAMAGSPAAADHNGPHVDITELNADPIGPSGVAYAKHRVHIENPSLVSVLVDVSSTLSGGTGATFDPAHSDYDEAGCTTNGPKTQLSCNDLLILGGDTRVLELGIKTSGEGVITNTASIASTVPPSSASDTETTTVDDDASAGFIPTGSCVTYGTNGTKVCAPKTDPTTSGVFVEVVAEDVDGAEAAMCGGNPCGQGVRIKYSEYNNEPGYGAHTTTDPAVATVKFRNVCNGVSPPPECLKIWYRKAFSGAVAEVPACPAPGTALADGRPCLDKVVRAKGSGGYNTFTVNMLSDDPGLLGIL